MPVEIIPIKIFGHHWPSCISSLKIEKRGSIITATGSDHLPRWIATFISCKKFPFFSLFFLVFQWFRGQAIFLYFFYIIICAPIVNWLRHNAAPSFLLSSIYIHRKCCIIDIYEDVMKINRRVHFFGDNSCDGEITIVVSKHEEPLLWRYN